MTEIRAQRRLAAILAADVVGYSRLMEQDESGTLAALKARRQNVLAPVLSQFNGRIVKVMGDGVLVEFGSAVDAVQCAVQLQDAFFKENQVLPEEKHIVLRIGINLGDVIVEGTDIYGDGVNIAARLEGLAEPGGICISGSVHEQVKRKLDLSFDDMGLQSVKNIAEPVSVYRIRGPMAKTGVRHAETPPMQSERPAIAVLPFTNMSGDPEQEYFSDGITEDIITELSRFRSLLVIARHSSFAYKGKPVTVQQVGRELGVEYVLEGSVRRVGERVRITAQLIEARTSAHIWADRLDRDLANLFAMQDEVTERIVTTIADRLERTEQGRAVSKRPEAMRTYDYILRARAIVSETAEANQQSRALYEKALALEPTSIPALTGIAWSFLIDWVSRWSSPSDDAFNQAYKLSRQALALDITDYRVHILLGYVLSNQKQYAEALSHYQQAMALNSNNADGAAHMGNLLISLGRFSDALDWFQKAERLSPLHPAWYLYGIGEAYYGARQYEQAIAPLQTAINRFPKFVTPRRHLAAVYAQLGRMEEARIEISEIRKLDPLVCIALYRERIKYKNSEDLDHYLDGLRKAGLQE